MKKPPNNLAILIRGSGQIINWKKYFKGNSYSGPWGNQSLSTAAVPKGNSTSEKLNAFCNQG